MPSVEMGGKAHQFGLGGIGPGHPQSQMGGLGSAYRKPNPLGAGNQGLNQFRPLQLQLMGCPVVRPAGELFPHRLLDHRMVVPQHEGTVAAEVVDILPPVHVPLAGSLSPGDKQGMRLQHSGLMGDAAGKDLLRPPVELCRGGCGFNVGLKDLRFGLHGSGIHGQST